MAPRELVPRVGYIVTNLSRPAERVVAFYNQRGKAEQYIKEGKCAIKWTRLSCRRSTTTPCRLQLHALAYNLANFMRTLALPRWNTGLALREKRQDRCESGCRRYVTFQLAEVAVPRELFRKILSQMIYDENPFRVGRGNRRRGEKCGGGTPGWRKIWEKGLPGRPTHQNQAIGRLRRESHYNGGAI